MSTFNPVNFSVTNWIASFNALGATSAVLTAKHGCGFLGWQTKTTLPDGTPYRYHVPDEYLVVDEFVKEMKNAGLGYGFYYSLTNNFYLNEFGHNVRPSNTLLPGQANVTQQQYEDIAVAQVHELWTQFGEKKNHFENDITTVLFFPSMFLRRHSAENDERSCKWHLCELIYQNH